MTTERYSVDAPLNNKMDALWERLENFLQQNAPKIYDGLLPGASEEQIAEVEQRCGFQFPTEVRQSYLRHNGQRSDERYEPMGGTFIPCSYGLLPMARILDEWLGNLDTLEDIKDDMPDGDRAGPEVKRVFLDAAWVPFAKEGSGANQFCIDFDPAVGGRIGQIVQFDHEAYGQQCVAPDFMTWFHTLVTDLETGRLIWNEEYEGFDYPEETDEV